MSWVRRSLLIATFVLTSFGVLFASRYTKPVHMRPPPQERVEPYPYPLNEMVPVSSRFAVRHGLPPRTRRRSFGQDWSLQVVSDLHIEHLGHGFIWNLPVVAPAIALLGDLGDPHESKYSDLLELMSTRYEKVYVMLGNHEFYGDDYHRTKGFVQRAIDGVSRDNVELLDRTSVLHEDVRLLGVTLWADLPENRQGLLQRFVSDFDMMYKADFDGLEFNKSSPTALFPSIDSENEDAQVEWFNNGTRRPATSPRVTPADLDALHHGDVAWLEQHLTLAEQAGETVVVLSHHTPVRNMRGLVFFPEEDAPLSPLGCFLGSDLLNLVERHPSIVAWVFGHTHLSCDFHYTFADGRAVRFVSNQVGYPNELETRKSLFRPELALRLHQPPSLVLNSSDLLPPEPVSAIQMRVLVVVHAAA